MVLAGCGFRMRGSAELPFQTLYVPNSDTGIALDLKRNIEAGTRTKVVDDPKSADAILELSNEARTKMILSLTGAGRVREYRLLYTITFRVHDGRGGEFVPPTVLQLTRDMTYSDAEILAKESEERLLIRDMQADMVQQVLRRVALSEPAKPVVK